MDQYNPKHLLLVGSLLTFWYQLGSAKGICCPKASSGSDSSSLCSPFETSFSAAATALWEGLMVTVPGAGSGVGSTLGLVSREPTWSLLLYFFRMPSLWYFQNCLDASLPATRWRIFLPPNQCHPFVSDCSCADSWWNWWLRTRVVILKLGQVVNVAIDCDVQVTGLVVRRHVAGGKCLGHPEVRCGRVKGSRRS